MQKGTAPGDHRLGARRATRTVSAFVSQPLTEDMVVLGPAAANISLSSSAPDTDLGLTLGEVRPDGTEIRVSTGVQRASMRNVDPARSTATRPAFTLDEHRPLLPGVNVVPVQILPVAHVFRAGSRIRLTIAAVGGDREEWRYDSVDPDGGQHRGHRAPRVASAPRR